MSRYLITGATTVIAYDLIRRLLDDPSTTYILAVGKEARRTEPFGDGRVHYQQVDLSRARSIRSLMFGPVRKHAVNTIIHMATHRKAVVGERVHALNVHGPRQILRLAERVDSVERFVYRSYGCVYSISSELPVRIDEDHPLRIGPGTAQYVLDRVEADLAVCARMGMSRVRIAVLRCAECLVEGAGSQLWDYLRARVCFRPVGFDPMLNVISASDLSTALALSAKSDADGVFTIPGYDTLPLSRLIGHFGRADVPLPGPMLRPLYGFRRLVRNADFHYAINRGLLHFGGILDGQRAARVLGYRPERPIDWPLDFDEIGRRARADNERSFRGRFERWLEVPAARAPDEGPVDRDGSHTNGG